MKGISTVMGCITVCSVLLLSSTPAFADNLVLNGGFEEFDLNEGKRGRRTNWNYFDGQYLDANKSELGWQVTNGGTLEVRKNGVVGRAHNNSGYFMELDAHNYQRNVAPDDELGIFQDIVTEAGKTYQLSFAYAARPGINGNRNQFEVSFGENFSQNLDGGDGKTQVGQAWKMFSTNIVATSDITRLQFNYLGRRDTLGAHLDNVSVAAVPEPASILGLSLFGMVGVGSIVKRKQIT